MALVFILFDSWEANLGDMGNDGWGTVRRPPTDFLNRKTFFFFFQKVTSYV
jgi:hypothetical protein